VKEITDDMNQRGVFANMKTKFQSKSSMHNLLKNRRYIGEYRFGETVTPGGMPAIVPQEIFDKVQTRMANNRQKNPMMNIS